MEPLDFAYLQLLMKFQREPNFGTLMEIVALHGERYFVYNYLWIRKFNAAFFFYYYFLHATQILTVY